jgi:hypothetical protein
MIIVSSFSLEHNKEKEYFLVKTDEVVPCPFCDGLLYYRDSVIRNVLNFASEVMRLLLRRLLCDTCNSLHRELPDIVQPYKHYSAEVVQAVLDDSEEASTCAADNSTIRRWMSDFAVAEPDINQRLSSVYVRMTEETVPISRSEDILDKIRRRAKRWLPFVMNLLINGGHKICTQFAFCLPVIIDKLRTTIKITAERGRKSDKTTEDTS